MDAKKIEKFLVKTHKKNRIAGAYIIYGGDKKQRNETAVFLSMLLNCKDSPPCGSCPDCERIKKGLHPDVRRIIPSKSILSIDDVRMIKDDIYLTPYSGRKKVYIFDIEYMRDESANALLKILEEPPPYGVLVIQSSSTNFFLPTILSRCQKIRLNYKLPEENIQDAAAEGREFSKMLTLAKKQDFYGFFKQVDAFLKEKEREEVDEWLGKIVLFYRDAYFNRAGVPGEFLVNKRAEDALVPRDRERFLETVEKILELKRQVRYNINLKLGFDTLFLSIS
jgi:DNA polymerase III gamma/tau subunit